MPRRHLGVLHGVDCLVQVLLAQGLEQSIRRDKPIHVQRRHCVGSVCIEETADGCKRDAEDERLCIVRRHQAGHV